MGEERDVSEFFGIDANGDCSDVDDSALVGDGIGHCVKIQDTITCGEEVAGIIVRVEANIIAWQDTLKNLTSNGKDTITVNTKSQKTRLETRKVGVSVVTGIFHCWERGCEGRIRF